MQLLEEMVLEAVEAKAVEAVVVKVDFGVMMVVDQEVEAVPQVEKVVKVVKEALEEEAPLVFTDSIPMLG